MEGLNKITLGKCLPKYLNRHSINVSYFYCRLCDLFFWTMECDREGILGHKDVGVLNYPND